MKKKTKWSFLLLVIMMVIMSFLISGFLHTKNPWTKLLFFQIYLLLLPLIDEDPKNWGQPRLLIGFRKLYFCVAEFVFYWILFVYDNLLFAVKTRSEVLEWGMVLFMVILYAALMMFSFPYVWKKRIQ